MFRYNLTSSLQKSPRPQKIPSTGEFPMLSYLRSEGAELWTQDCGEYRVGGWIFGVEQVELSGP